MSETSINPNYSFSKLKSAEKKLGNVRNVNKATHMKGEKGGK
jgi:hypothetical protein